MSLFRTLRSQFSGLFKKKPRSRKSRRPCETRLRLEALESREVLNGVWFGNMPVDPAANAVASSTANTDTIVDFEAGIDRIELPSALSTDSSDTANKGLDSNEAKPDAVQYGETDFDFVYRWIKSEDDPAANDVSMELIEFVHEGFEKGDTAKTHFLEGRSIGSVELQSVRTDPYGQFNFIVSFDMDDSNGLMQVPELGCEVLVAFEPGKTSKEAIAGDHDVTQAAPLEKVDPVPFKKFIDRSSPLLLAVDSNADAAAAYVYPGVYISEVPSG